ncbi:MAG TPA: hypothetical protein DCX06_07795 [Opitutae bacterium]|nr:hypothetical protein [Opitutae bacterium]
MLRIFLHTLSLLIAFMSCGHAAVFDFHTFWAQPGDVSPDKRFIYGSASLLYDAVSLEPRYHFDGAREGYFSQDGSQYVYHDRGLRRFTFATGKDESLVDLENIQYVYRSLDTHSFLFVTGEVSETNGKEQVSIYAKLDGEPLVQLASFQAESLEELNPIEIESHPDKDIVVLEVQEYSRPTTPMGDGTYGPRKIYELNIRTKELKLVVEWPAELKSSEPRPIAAGSDIYEYTSEGSYVLFKPKTGEITRTISIPNVNFHLGAVGEVEAKRTVTELGVQTHFLDIVVSGTLKTLRNIPQNPPPDRKWKRPVTFDGQSPEHAWFNDFKTLTQVDVESWTAINTYNIPVSWPVIIGYSPTKPGDLIFLKDGDFYNYNLETQHGELLDKGPQPFKLSNLSFHPTEPEFYGIDPEGNIHRYRMTEIGLSRANLGKGPESFSIDKDGETVFFLPNSEGWLRRSDLKSFPRGEYIEYQAPYPNSVLPNYSLDNIYTDTAKYLIQVDSFYSYLHDYETGKFIAKLEEHGRGDYSSGMISHPIALALAPDDSAFVSLQTDDEYSMETRESSSVTRLSYTAITDTIKDFPEADWSVVLTSEEHGLLGFTEDGTGIQVFNHSSGELTTYKTSDGNLAKTQKIPLELAVKKPASGYVARVSDSKAALSIYQNDAAGEATYVGELTFYNEGDDYLFAASNGRFDATQPVIDGVSIKKAFTFQPLNQIFEQSYQPGLFLNSFSGIELAGADEQLEAVIIPPVATMSSRNTKVSTQIELTIDVYAPQNRIERYDLFVNDKLIRTNYTPTYKEKVIVDLLPETNEFKLVAVDVKGVTSAPAIITARPPEGYILEQQKRTTERKLYILAIGIDDYTNPQHKLNYAVADASAVLEKLQQLNAGIFDSVRTTLMTNSEADKNGILRAFAQISAEATPQDTFVFYFAGHGVLSLDDQNFYLVPQDALQIYGEGSGLAKSGISSQQLREQSSQIQARKQLFILDACNSAGALLAFKQRGASQEKAIAQLARSTGTHWIAASSGDQFATEFASLGHGAFTYTLLKGLNGGADTGDKRITINEIKAYVESMLPEVTKEHKGRPQYPASYGYGQDFPIALLP